LRELLARQRHEGAGNEVVLHIGANEAEEITLGLDDLSMLVAPIVEILVDRRTRPPLRQGCSLHRGRARLDDVLDRENGARQVGINSSIARGTDRSICLERGAHVAYPGLKEEIERETVAAGTLSDRFALDSLMDWSAFKKRGAESRRALHETFRGSQSRRVYLRKPFVSRHGPPEYGKSCRII